MDDLRHQRRGGVLWRDLDRGRFVQDPARVPMIPNWHRVLSARSEFLADLRHAVDLDRSGS